MRNWVFLLIALTSHAQAASLGDFDLTNKSWIDPFTAAYIEELEPSTVPMSPEVTKAIIQIKRAQLKLQGQSLSLNIKRRQRDGAQVFVVTFRSPQRSSPLGVWIFSIRAESGVHVSFEYLKFSRDLLLAQVGVGNASFELFQILSKSLRASSERLEAGWLGRYFWAKKGFDFQTDSVVYENGHALSQLQLARNNFRRFCLANGLLVRDLRLSAEQPESRISENLQELRTPLDFARVIHKDGFKINVSPYVDHNEIGDAKTLDIGKAFMVSDYRPSSSQINSILVGGLFRSDQAMPPWFGVRNFSCEDELVLGQDLQQSDVD